MTEAMLETYISRRFEASPGPNTHFEWHGGEPTVLGLDYFRNIVKLQRKHLPAGRTVTNGLQTNGILLNEEWVGFLSGESFSVGLSLDGPDDLHDCFRRSPAGDGTHSLVVKAFELLQKHKVFCNILCVLHAVNSMEPERVYVFFRDLGVKYLQFLPLVSVSRTEKDTVSRESVEPKAFGNFLCRVFDLWIAGDVGRIVVQNFDEALRPVYGVPHALCVHRETCGDVAVLEHDGSFYACDHFVNTAHRIGNIEERTLKDLVSDPALTGFGLRKKESLPEYCRNCDVLQSCNGGCPKDRFIKTPDGKSGLNYLCEGYQAFFRYSRAELTKLADHMKAGKPLRSFVR
jgi:uncharacterized protein